MHIGSQIVDDKCVSKRLHQRLAFESQSACTLFLWKQGRSFSQNAAFLPGRVVYNKKLGRARFLVPESALNDPSSSATDHSLHSETLVAIVARAPSSADDVETVTRITPADHAGSSCPSGDVMARCRSLRHLDRCAMASIFSDGASGMVMRFHEHKSGLLLSHAGCAGQRRCCVRGQSREP
jgi:hypothetical protein